MAYVSARGADSAVARSKPYVSSSAQRPTHFSSRPSSEGFSGTPTRAPGALLSGAVPSVGASVTMTGILRAMSTSIPEGRRSADADLARVEQALLARWPESRLEPSLTRISALLDLLGAPHRAFPVVQVTGTNGKTTTARMIDELLRGFGLRVGRFTSPHLESVRERIVLDGEPLPAHRFVEVYDDIGPYVQLVDAGSDVPMSFFEVMVAMAYAAFAEAPVDVAVIEVGMGGTWDATNVADARVAVITPVSLDHAEYLGPDVATIATEKAGIIKPAPATDDGVPGPDVVAVLAHQPPGALEALVRRAIEVDATVAREGTEFGVLERRIAVGGQQVRLQGLGGGGGGGSPRRSTCRSSVPTRRRTPPSRWPPSRPSWVRGRPPAWSR